MELSLMYADWLNSRKVDKERDPFRLFVSDVGKCPRQVAYRFKQEAKDFKSPQSLANKTIMFELALHMEAQLEQAMMTSGILIDFQRDIEFTKYGRENWGGRLDFVAAYGGGPRIIELKTTMPTAFKFIADTIGYIEHHYQAMVYDIYYEWGDLKDHRKRPLVVYFDRGGQNTALEKECAVTRVQTLAEMDKLEEMREAVRKDVMPDKLPKVLKLRSYKKDIMLEPDHRCSFCDYSMACDPDLGKSCWAHRDDAKLPFKSKKAADSEMLEQFITEQLQEVLV